MEPLEILNREPCHLLEVEVVVGNKVHSNKKLKIVETITKCCFFIVEIDLWGRGAREAMNVCFFKGIENSKKREQDYAALGDCLPDNVGEVLKPLAQCCLRHVCFA